MSSLTRCLHVHYASTPRTRALRSVISRMMSKCRTRQLESCDTLSTFFRGWLERGVRVESVKDPRLSDGWCWHLVRAVQLLSPGVSIQWSAGSAHRTADTKHVENLAVLSEVKGLKPSSRVTGRGQHDVLELSTAAKAVVFRGGARFASCLGPRGLAHYQNNRRGARTSQCPYARSTRKW